MRKFFSVLLIFIMTLTLAGCGDEKCCEAIELMGAGDRIHDTYTFANVGTKIKKENDIYTIYGEVAPLESEDVKKEFKIDEDVTHVVAIKLTAIETEVKKDEVQISVNGLRAYDAEHLNGSDYTFIILEAVPSQMVTISVKWNKDATELNYVLTFAADLKLM